MVSVKTIMERLEEPLRKQDIDPKAAGEVKEPWMMTQDEWNNPTNHKDIDVAFIAKIRGRGTVSSAWAIERFLRENGYPKYKDVLKLSQSEQDAINKRFKDSDYGNPFYFDEFHKNNVKQALSEGKPVPPEVLKDYPGLVKEYDDKVKNYELMKRETPEGNISYEPIKKAVTPTGKAENTSEPKVAAGVIRNLMLGANTHARIDEALDAINKIIGGYGVEAIVDNNWDRYYQDLGLLYVNMGDAYCPTVCYDTRKEKWLVCSWGDIVEGNQKRFGGR